MSKVLVLVFEDSESELIAKILNMIEEQQNDVMYIEKPFDLLFEGLIIHMMEKQVKVDGEEQHLSKMEFAVLCHLARHSGWVQSKRQIFEAVWSPDSEADYHTVETVIYTLRKKIDPNTSNPRFIKNVPGHGYRFIGKKLT